MSLENDRAAGYSKKKTKSELKGNKADLVSMPGVGWQAVLPSFGRISVSPLENQARN